MDNWNDYVKQDSLAEKGVRTREKEMKIAHFKEYQEIAF